MKDKPFSEAELQELFGHDPELLETMRVVQDKADQPAPGQDVMDTLPDAELEAAFGDDPEMLKFMKEQRTAMVRRDVEGAEQDIADEVFHRLTAKRLNEMDTEYARGVDGDMTELEREEKKAPVLPFRKK